jgi:F-type H+-transporting ATPase subunit delta
MAKLISGTYAEALFELALEEHREDEFLEEAQGLLIVLKENPELNQMMNHPKIGREEKISTLKAVFEGRISGDMLGFLTVIVEKNRYGSIEQILDGFVDKMKEHKGIGIAYVASAVVLTDEQKKQVEARLLATTRYRQVEMHYEVCTELIGGMVIRIGDRVVDSSIRSRLSDMERSLMKLQLA